MAGGHELKKTVYCKKSDFQIHNIGIIFILQIIEQRGVTNKIISIFNMLLYQPIGELYYFNIPLVKYLNMYIVQERLLSIYSERASKLSIQYHNIVDCVQKRLSCTYSPLYILHPCIFQNVYFRKNCILDCTLYQLYQDSINLAIVICSRVGSWHRSHRHWCHLAGR